jgi:transcriptional regulator with XRE-family HTH domain
MAMVSMSTRIRRARTLAAFSQAELARRVGVERSAVTQWERPNGTTPSVNHLAQIAADTGVCFEWLATGRGPSTADPGTYDQALVLDDYVRDPTESRALSALRRLSVRKRTIAVQIIELLSG